MAPDKIFVLILSLAFAAFIGYLMWRSKKNESAGNPGGPAVPPPDEPPAEEAPPAAQESPSGKKARSRSRRR